MSGNNISDDQIDLSSKPSKYLKGDSVYLNGDDSYNNLMRETLRPTKKDRNYRYSENDITTGGVKGESSNKKSGDLLDVSGVNLRDVVMNGIGRFDSKTNTNFIKNINEFMMNYIANDIINNGGSEAIKLMNNMATNMENFKKFQQQQQNFSIFKKSSINDIFKKSNVNNATNKPTEPNAQNSKPQVSNENIISSNNTTGFNENPQQAFQDNDLKSRSYSMPYTVQPNLPKIVINTNNENSQIDLQDHNIPLVTGEDSQNPYNKPNDGPTNPNHLNNNTSNEVNENTSGFTRPLNKDLNIVGMAGGTDQNDISRNSQNDSCCISENRRSPSESFVNVNKDHLESGSNKKTPLKSPNDVQFKQFTKENINESPFEKQISPQPEKLKISPVETHSKEAPQTQAQTHKTNQIQQRPSAGIFRKEISAGIFKSKDNQSVAHNSTQGKAPTTDMSNINMISNLYNLICTNNSQVKKLNGINMTKIDKNFSQIGNHIKEKQFSEETTPDKPQNKLFETDRH